MGLIEEQERFYDARWRDIRYADGLKLQRATAILAALAEIAVTEPRMLELGCGTGWLSAILAQFGPTVGVDLSGEAIKLACDRYPFVTFLHADIGRWSAGTDIFDVVVSHEVIEHLEDQAHHLRLASDSLRPGGHLILTTPNADTVRAAAKPGTRPLSAQMIENILTRAELMALVRGAAFEITQISTLTMGYGRGGLRTVVNSPKVRGLLRRIGIGRAAEYLALASGAGLHTIVVARKPQRREAGGDT